MRRRRQSRPAREIDAAVSHRASLIISAIPVDRRLRPSVRPAVVSASLFIAHPLSNRVLVVFITHAMPNTKQKPQRTIEL